MDSNMPPTNQPNVPSPPPPPPPFLPTPPRLGPPPVRRSGNGWKVMALIFACLLAISLVFNPLHLARMLLRGSAAQVRTAGPRLEEAVVEDNDSPNKIA